MGLLDQLRRYGEFMQGETACTFSVGQPAEDSPGGEELQPSNPTLESILSMHCPGAIGGKNVNGERAPLLLSIERHRRIPINWEAALEDEGARSVGQIDLIRERIEATWLLDSRLFDVVPEDAIAEVNNSEYCIREFTLAGLAEGKPYLEVDLPNDAMVLRDNPKNHDQPRHFALEFRRRRQQLGAEVEWSDVDSTVEVFKKAASEELFLSTLTDRLRSASTGPFKERAADPLSFPELSSRMPVRAFSQRMLSEWREEMTESLISQNVFRTNINDGLKKEKYWTRDEDLRRKAITDGSKSLFLRPTDGGDEAEKSVEDSTLVLLEERDAWIIKAGSRRYQVIFRSTTAAGQDLSDPKTYRQAWDETILGVIPLAWCANADETLPDSIPYSYLEVVDLSPQLIVDEYARIKTELDISQSMSSLGDEILKKIPTMVEAGITDVTALAQNVREYKSSKFSAEWRIRVLKNRAERLGYHLATGIVNAKGEPDQMIYIPTGPNIFKEVSVPLGRLYTAEERVATYTVMRSQLVKHWSLGFGNPLTTIPIPGLGLPGFGFGRRRRRRDYPVEVSVRYTGLREVQLATEPWEVKREQLQDAGFNCVFTELGSMGYVTTEGIPLRELLWRANVDEQYRQRLAIFIPIYQERLDQGLVRVRYLIAIRPETGLEPIGFPSVYCEESITYKAEWRGNELGELIHSVALAPGEEREVTITRTVEQKTERVDSITSVLDVTQSQRFDLQTSLQDTIVREKNSKKTSNWNVNAGVSLGPFKGGGGGGGTQETTVRDFAESIRKSAMQATKEMRTQQKQEVRSSTTTSTSVATTESTKTKFSNINLGRTLNLFFYQVNNVFDAGLFLDNLRLAYTPSVELIQGTGIHDTLTFEFKDLRKLIECVCNDSALARGDVLYDLSTLERRILRSVVKLILDDYVEPSDEPSVGGGGKISVLDARNVPDSVLDDLKPLLGGLFGWLVDTTGKSQTYELAVDDECDRYTELLRRLYRNGKPLEPHTLIAPSSAVYGDAIVGMRPSTEPYSERMREVEIALKKAEVEDRLSSAAARKGANGASLVDRAP